MYATIRLRSGEAVHRLMNILKAMGVNAIRTAHNPPAPELLDLCDRMGFLVMDEAFDVWKKGKNAHDYHLYWDEWHRRDLEDLVRRDRNHPSVVVWSIGNEILEQWDTSGTAIARELAGIVRALDDTRPVTAATNDPRPENFVIRSGVLDLIGYNYNHDRFAAEIIRAGVLAIRVSSNCFLIGLPSSLTAVMLPR